ncbi:trophoblast glycoprotein-like [Acipenser oxyrinchus oxyrinchus]|uniref:Trophoblast glycoprotein-like n=1 Tax=Acipenser oxyrinchus oxyrinchus TaxID=40147 RepID=A0AAD8CSB3_ACIOX|nr:trophoblast glycoprotein-like [Acipenser oxyrinchus oxyrinchus]
MCAFAVCLALVVLFSLFSPGLCDSCPLSCECSEAARTVKCVFKDVTEIPAGIPAYTRNLYLTGNSISRIGPASFRGLGDVTKLSLSNNRITVIESHTFAALHNLRVLDLSNNGLSVIHPDSFNSENNSIRDLNLSRALYNHSAIGDLAAAMCRGGFGNLRKLDLSENEIVYLPIGIFSSLTALRHLDLRNNSLVVIKNSTFAGLDLEALDLRLNAIQTLRAGSLRELDRMERVQIQMRDNPFVCNCGIEDFADWLNATAKVVDADRLVCVLPKELHNTSLRAAQDLDLGCHYSESAEIALQTSYAFLGVVLGFVGVIFLFVLYLNRKGIKKWANELRDACREVMEGYHYRYEIESDPRVGQLSTSDL